MKELLVHFAQYHSWANKKLFERINKLSDEQIHADVKSSFSGLFKTVQHMWFAEDVWWQRLHLAENINPAAVDFTGGFRQLQELYTKQSAQWEEWVKKSSENQINHVFAYQNSKKEQFKQPVHEVLLHLFNHATFHRGQLVTILRQLGITDIPQTDFLIYCRAKGK